MSREALDFLCDNELPDIQSLKQIMEKLDGAEFLSEENFKSLLRPENRWMLSKEAFGRVWSQISVRPSAEQHGLFNEVFRCGNIEEAIARISLP